LETPSYASNASQSTEQDITLLQKLCSS